MKQNSIKKIESKQIVIKEDNAGRRIDNYLIRHFDNIPKSRVYQMLRKGEVRVNKGRIKQTYRLLAGDIVRLPPVYVNESEKPLPSNSLQQILHNAIIYEDEGMLVLNKPAGIVVHSGSGQAYGVIEGLRAYSKEFDKLELVHRLDKDTSGCLILAKTMPILRELHDVIKNNAVKKSYLALLAGQSSKRKWVVDSPLRKNTQRSGERIVAIDEKGKAALTKFFRERLFDEATLVSIELITGRTHQIRVHSASIKQPVIGDSKYGDRELNRKFRKLGLKRLFLHAASLKLKSPVTGKQILIEAPLPSDLEELLSKLSIKENY